MKNTSKALIAFLFVALSGTGFALFYAHEKTQETARWVAADQAVKKEMHEIMRKGAIGLAQKSFEYGVDRAKRARDENRNTGNRIAADQLFESTVARMARERDEAIASAKEKYP